MPVLRSARSSARASLVAAATIIGVLVLGLLSTPSGAVAAGGPQPTATASATPTAEPTAAPEDAATIAPTDAPSDEPSKPSADADPERAEGAETETDAPERAPPAADSETGDSGLSADDAEADYFAPFAALCDFGIMAAGVPEQPTEAWIETFET